MTDRELLEAAAKAAASGIMTPDDEDGVFLAFDIWGGGRVWNPLTDDGDALRLAVRLGIAVVPYPIYSRPKNAVMAKDYQHNHILRPVDGEPIEAIEVYAENPEAATRRAIVRAAAEIGKVMR